MEQGELPRDLDQADGRGDGGEALQLTVSWNDALTMNVWIVSMLNNYAFGWTRRSHEM